MTRKIPLLIGKHSSGKGYIVNLEELPNLFISYSHDDQLPGIFISFIHQLLQTNTPLLFTMSLSSRLAAHVKPIIPDGSMFMEFMHKDYEDGMINSIDEFVTALKEEVKARKSRKKKSVTAPVMLPDIIVIIDDIFEVLKSHQKKTPVSFIELLMNAADVGMYFILGSSGIYRSLLEQVIHFNPVLQKKLNKPDQQVQISLPLGAEMVVNPDGLLFFREKGEKIHTRLFPGSL